LVTGSFTVDVVTDFGPFIYVISIIANAVVVVNPDMAGIAASAVVTERPDCNS